MVVGLFDYFFMEKQTNDFGDLSLHSLPGLSSAVWTAVKTSHICSIS